MSNASHAFDASATEDPFITSTQCFPIPGLTSESPSSAPAACAFTWKLPKPTVEEVDDEDDRLSTYTFPAPEPTRPFCAPSSSVPSLTEDFDDPRDSIDIPEAEDELLATSLPMMMITRDHLLPGLFWNVCTNRLCGKESLSAWGTAWD
ncbi:hypothetical protein B0H14DRAFT_3460985 [Mycena olivaceomarginata]|nr:hypothetical protein B0H14DRAFT_3460985 [Mycena olivaceomarginata]